MRDAFEKRKKSRHTVERIQELARDKTDDYLDDTLRSVQNDRDSNHSKTKSMATSKAQSDYIPPQMHRSMKRTAGQFFQPQAQTHMPVLPMPASLNPNDKRESKGILYKALLHFK